MQTLNIQFQEYSKYNAIVIYSRFDTMKENYKIENIV